MTVYHKITGKILWANHLFVPDSYGNGPKNYKLNLQVDPENLDAFKTSGVRTKVKFDENNNAIILLKRPDQGRVGRDGEAFGGGRPTILDKDGNFWDDDVVIGNNSLVEAHYQTYDTTMGTGHRLDRVVVLEHVEYVPKEDEAAEPKTEKKVKKEKMPW